MKYNYNIINKLAHWLIIYLPIYYSLWDIYSGEDAVQSYWCRDCRSSLLIKVWLLSRYTKWFELLTHLLFSTDTADGFAAQSKQSIQRACVRCHVIDGFSRIGYPARLRDASNPYYTDVALIVPPLPSSLGLGHNYDRYSQCRHKCCYKLYIWRIVIYSSIYI